MVTPPLEVLVALLGCDLSKEECRMDWVLPCGWVYPEVSMIQTDFAGCQWLGFAISLLAVVHL